MTIAQKLEEKARKEGMLVGEQKGREAERQKTQLEIARNMLSNGMDHNVVLAMTGLTDDDLKQIRH